MRARDLAELHDRAGVILLTGEDRGGAVSFDEPCFLVLVERLRFGTDEKPAAEIPDGREELLVRGRNVLRDGRALLLDQFFELRAKRRGLGRLIGRADRARFKIDDFIAAAAD